MVDSSYILRAVFEQHVKRPCRPLWIAYIRQCCWHFCPFARLPLTANCISVVVCWWRLRLGLLLASDIVGFFRQAASAESLSSSAFSSVILVFYSVCEGLLVIIYSLLTNRLIFFFFLLFGYFLSYHYCCSVTLMDIVCY